MLVGQIKLDSILEPTKLGPFVHFEIDGRRVSTVGPFTDQLLAEAVVHTQGEVVAATAEAMCRKLGVEPNVTTQRFGKGVADDQ